VIVETSGFINLLSGHYCICKPDRSRMNRIMGSEYVPVFNLWHEFLRLPEKKRDKGSNINYKPDSILFDEDVYRFVHSRDPPGCSQRMYDTTGKTCSNSDCSRYNGCRNRSPHRNNNSQTNSNPDRQLPMYQRQQPPGYLPHSHRQENLSSILRITNMIPTP
jgi:hypothetical protein